MGKFSKAIAVNDTNATAPDPKCQSCGWHFAADNAAIHTHGKMTRTEPRTQINFKKFGVTIIRCSDCFERELFSTRAHSKSGTDGEGLYRNAIS